MRNKAEIDADIRRARSEMGTALFLVSVFLMGVYFAVFSIGVGR